MSPLTYYQFQRLLPHMSPIYYSHPMHSHPMHSHPMHSHPMHSHPMHSHPMHSHPMHSHSMHSQILQILHLLHSHNLLDCSQILTYVQWRCIEGVVVDCH